MTRKPPEASLQSEEGVHRRRRRDGFTLIEPLVVHAGGHPWGW